MGAARDDAGQRRARAGHQFILTPFKVESADRFVASDPTTGPTGPRFLSVGTKAGDVVVVKVTTVKARIVSLFLMPKVEAYL